ncbi:ABC transporter permease [Nannocystaceae bacterium ST9]
MPVSLFLALSFLREYRTQTALTLGAVAVGVAVMVFLSALIDGLQVSLIARTLGTQAHVIVRPLEESARALLPDEGLHLRHVERPAQRIRSIAQWQRIDGWIRADADVVATSPAAMGDAFATQGSANRPVVILGIDPARFDQVIAVGQRMTRGVYRLEGAEAVIGIELAGDLGVDVGDKLRLETPAGTDALLTIRGVFDLGNQQVNQRWVLVPLRTGQTLLGLPGGANTLHVKVREIFAAERVAQRIADDTGLSAESWMQANQQLLIGLRSQSSSSYTIQFFVFLAVAIGIASVLVVTVVQRTREIGILRAMGTPRRRIATVFVIQGGLVGFVGSLLGAGLGAGLSVLFVRLSQNPDGTAMFPIVLTAKLVFSATALATLTGVLAAVLPARQAGRLDPVEAIRHV